ncbi:MAG: hypothetical protein ACU0A4_11925 [Paracoccaceae bacterium]
MDQIQELAEDFNLPEDAVFALSQALAYPLSPNFRVRNVIEVLQKQAKGSVEVEKLIKKIRLARSNLTAAQELFAELNFNFPGNTGKRNDWLRSKLDEALMYTVNLEGATTRGEKLHGQTFAGKPDKRRNRDERRRAVLMVIFDIWHYAGRNVSVTSQDTSRGGPLVDFSRAVVRCITDPPYELSGETVWQEIKALRRQKTYR